MLYTFLNILILIVVKKKFHKKFKLISGMCTRILIGRVYRSIS